MEIEFKGKKRNAAEDIPDNSTNTNNKDFRKKRENNDKNVFIDLKTQLKSEKFEFYYKAYFI
jgi:hypothetical protein